jgi:hypothetical protein
MQLVQLHPKIAIKLCKHICTDKSRITRTSDTIYQKIKKKRTSNTFITRLLAIVPIRSGPANGSIHVANIKIRKSQPDSANQRKKIVYKKMTRNLKTKIE